MIDCKNALEEAGEPGGRVELLRLKGGKDVNKRALRTAANGLVTAELEGAGQRASRCTARPTSCEEDLFQQVAAEIARTAIRQARRPTGRASRPETTETKPGTTVQQLIEEAGASLKEKLELGRFAGFESGYVASYLHRSDAALPPTLRPRPAGHRQRRGRQGPRPAGRRDEALYTARDDVPADVVEKERRIAEQISRDEGKPEQAIRKIVDGRLNAYFKDVVLTEQAFVKRRRPRSSRSCSQNGVTVKSFARLQVGQA